MSNNETDNESGSVPADENKAKIDMAKVNMALAKQEVEEEGERGYLEKAPRVAVVDEDDLEQKFPVLAWEVGFSFSRQFVPHDVLKEYYEEIEFDEKYLPPTTNPRNAYENASKKRERVVHIDYLGHKIKATYMVRLVKDKDRPHRRQIIREVSLVNYVDDTERENSLQYKPILEWDWDEDKEKPVLYIFEKDDQAKSIAQREHNAMMRDFNLYKNSYSAKNLRDNIRKWVKEWNGIPFLISRGGVWIVSDQYRPELKKFERLFQTINEHHQIGNRSRFRVLPLADGEKTRKWVAEDVQEQVNKQLTKLFKKTLKRLENTEELARRDDESNADYQERIEKKRQSIEAKMDNQLDDVRMLKEHFENLIGQKINIDLTQVEEEGGTKAKSSRAKQILQAIGNVM